MSSCREGSSCDYWWEDEPLGTAGALRRIEDLDEPFLAMNGDMLTTLDYGHLMRFHHGHDGALTIATHQQERQHRPRGDRVRRWVRSTTTSRSRP